jgi:hypothetical protein
MTYKGAHSKTDTKKIILLSTLNHQRPKI